LCVYVHPHFKRETKRDTFTHTSLSCKLDLWPVWKFREGGE